MKPKIIFLPSNRLARPGQPVRFGIADAFERIGFDAEVLDVNVFPRNPLARRPSLLSSIDPWRAFRVLLARRSAAAVVSYYQSGALVILALRRLMGFKAPVVIVDIGDDTNWPLRARIVAFCVNRADAVFCFASEQARDLAARFPDAGIRFLPQQVDTRFLTPGETQGEYILSVGDDLSRDYATLQSAVAGLDTPVLVRSDRIASNPPIAPVPRGSEEALRALYRGAKLVVVPLHDMRHPGGISSLLEAFACGKAVVATRTSGICDYLDHEKNCLTVPANDAVALRAAIRRLLNDSALRERLGKVARLYAETELSQDRYAARLMEAFAGLVRRRAAYGGTPGRARP